MTFDDDKFFNYCKKCSAPVILLGVDIETETCYWTYLDDSFVKTNNSLSVNFDISKNFTKESIDSGDINFIEAWKNIITLHNERVKKYDELKSLFEELSKRANPAVGEAKRGYKQIHKFLDVYNGLLENEFLVLKEQLYPGQWKIGLAYYEFEKDRLSYATYPIPLGKNDVQIKRVDKRLHEDLMNQGLDFSLHASNPILKNPAKEAFEKIAGKLKDFIRYKLLIHRGSNFLANEFIFAFVDRFAEQMGLEKKNEYSVKELEIAYTRHLRFWIENSVIYLARLKRNGWEKVEDYLTKNRYDGLRPHFDPSSIISFMKQDEREKVAKVSKKLTEENKVDPSDWPFGNKDLPPGIFEEMLIQIKSTGEKISRIYQPKVYERKGGWIWSVFTREAAMQNCRIFCEHLLKTYQTIVRTNFPGLEKELTLLGDADKLVIISKGLKDEYKGIEDHPSFAYYYLSAESKYKDDPPLELIFDDAEGLWSREWPGKEITWQGRTYKVLRMKESVDDFLYEDLPMLEFIYSEISDRLRDYFKDKDDVSFFI